MMIFTHILTRPVAATSHDWGNVRVGDSVDTVAYISGCTFDGPVKIGQFSGKPSGRKGLPSGLYGSVLRNCAVMDEARVSVSWIGNADSGGC